MKTIILKIILTFIISGAMPAQFLYNFDLKLACKYIAPYASLLGAVRYGTKALTAKCDTLRFNNTVIATSFCALGILLYKMTRPNSSDQALIEAVKKDDIAVVKKLLESDANPNAPDIEGKSAVYHALSKSYWTFDRTPEQIRNNKSIKELLLSKGACLDHRFTDKHYSHIAQDSSPLLASATCAHFKNSPYENVKNLICKGAKLSPMGYFGFYKFAVHGSALHLACALINSGNFDTRDFPLADYMKIIKLLLYCGASATQKNRNGQTPQVILRSQDDPTLMDSLAQENARLDVENILTNAANIDRLLTVEERNEFEGIMKERMTILSPQAGKKLYEQTFAQFPEIPDSNQNQLKDICPLIAKLAGYSPE